MAGDEGLFIEIFRRGSRTYFNSSRFFPSEVRRDVFCLYAFVRTADDFVDRVPQDRAGFESFRETFEACRGGRVVSGGPIIDRFLETSERCAFEPGWVDGFLDSMRMDLIKHSYDDLGEILRYVYGSAEVIGLMMAAIMNLEEKAYPYARLLGRAMQYINFIRDIREDLGFGRTYIPASELKRHGFLKLSEEEAKRRPDDFRALIRDQISRYRIWQKAAEHGYPYIPRRCRIPIMTAADMYRWTAEQIATRPFAVFEGPVKPSRSRILRKAMKNLFLPAKG